MMATVPHVISGLGLRKFQADGFLLTRGYGSFRWAINHTQSVVGGTRGESYAGRPACPCVLTQRSRDTYPT